ncbi:MAG: substrate-binding domain-containing protein [Clostridiales Family XIII bacterium]|jgi:ribose transport system substrate-binding protein|nr:substrate-binding domain-containing protein [Clostridiales Family XIII bacterium]
MRKKLLAITLIAVLALSLLGACGEKKDDTAGSDVKTGEIAVLVPSADHGWTGAVLTYAQEEADSLSGDITAKVYAATSAKEQSEQIDDLLAQNKPPVGIVILPYDNTLESAIVKIAESDIPFVQFDRIIDNETVTAKVVANVKGDNEGIGKESALRFIQDGIKPGDNVYVIIGDTSSVPQMRNKGFTDTLKDNDWTDDQINAIEYSKATGWSRSEGKQIFIDWVNGKTAEQIGTYKYIFTHDDEIAMGILEALASSEIEQSKKDAFLASIEAIGTSSGLNEMYEVLKGQHANTAYPDLVANFDLFSVTYDPAMIKHAIEDMVKFLNGEEVPKDDTISVAVVDETNVNDFQGF